MQLRKLSNVKAACQKIGNMVKTNHEPLRKDEGNVQEISRKGRGKDIINKRHINNKFSPYVFHRSL